MKTKIKFLVSIFALTLIFTACKKDAVTPELVLDCLEVVNGVAVIDSCGDCQGAYVYNMITHDPSEIVMLGGDTNGASATLTAGQVIILPQDAGNPYWNSGCIPAVVYDCMGVENGVAVVDSCGDCQGSYVYNMITHDPTEIVMLGGDTNGISVTLLPGQVIILPEDAGNPYWNSGCK
ncbi:MAG: Uncharacterised protein [Cryomorphaceae bacterium]|nr:MAG: Uncharacterised protein [Cryomorphaceae bacterium]